MQLTKMICFDSAIFIEKKTVENGLWAKCGFCGQKKMHHACMLCTSVLYFGPVYTVLYANIEKQYVQANLNIVLCVTYNTSKEDLFKRALTFLDSLKASYNQDHPTSDGTMHPDYRQDRCCRCCCPSATRRYWV